MSKSQQQALYSAPLLERYGIKPFVIDPRTMDIEGSFIDELTASIRSGYDPSKPLIVSKSDDERCDGVIVDGRHRAYVLSKLPRADLPSPFPIAYVEVKDPNHLRALVSSYEQKSMSKASRFAKEHIHQNLKAIVEDKFEDLGEGGVFDYIRSLGFSDASVIGDIIDGVTGKTRKRKPLKQAGADGPISRTLPAHLTQGWVSEGVYAKPDERLDLLINWEHRCPDCKAPLKITTDGLGKVLKVETAPKITK